MNRHEDTPEHFSVHGWMRVRAAFTTHEAVAMRAAVWRALAAVGIRDGDPSTWTKERPEHLQHARSDPAFRAVGSARLLEAIDAVLEGQSYEMPKNWGSPFLAFPSTQAWTVPSRGWHIDANYLSALSPPDGVRIHALFGRRRVAGRRHADRVRLTPAGAQVPPGPSATGGRTRGRLSHAA